MRITSKIKVTVAAGLAATALAACGTAATGPAATAPASQPTTAPSAAPTQESAPASGPTLDSQPAQLPAPPPGTLADWWTTGTGQSRTQEVQTELGWVQTDLQANANGGSLNTADATTLESSAQGAIGSGPPTTAPEFTTPYLKAMNGIVQACEDISEGTASGVQAATPLLQEAAANLATAMSHAPTS